MIRLWVQSLKFEGDKCEFLRKELYFLGYKVTADGVTMDEKKIAAIKNNPVPTNTKQLKAFLGIAGLHRKFVPRFSPIASPLHKMTGEFCHMCGGSSRQRRFRH